MTVHELISHLSTLPRASTVRLALIDHEGLSIDVAAGDVDHVHLDPGAGGESAVWLAGTVDDIDPPTRLDHRCHCGIVHPIDTDGVLCPLPSRSS